MGRDLPESPSEGQIGTWSQILIPETVPTPYTICSALLGRQEKSREFTLDQGRNVTPHPSLPSRPRANPHSDIRGWRQQVKSIPLGSLFSNPPPNIKRSLGLALICL